MQRNQNPRQQDMGNDALTPALRRDLEASFGVPPMRLPLAALAVSPRFLSALWETLKPVVESGDFFQAAQRLRADAYTRMFNYFRIPDLHAPVEGESLEAGAKLIDFVELFQARSALFLLFFSLEAQALNGPVGRSQIPAAPPPRPLFPQVHWEEEEEWKEEEERLSIEARGQPVQEMQPDRELALVNPEYAVLGRWPGFFRSYRDCLKTVVASPLYGDWQHSTRSLAWRLAQELPGPVQLSRWQLRRAGLAERHLGTVAHVSDTFLQNLSGLLLNMAVARIGLEQGSRPFAASAAPAERLPNSMPIEPGRVA
jgi:Halocarboxylic acid dehydrogenase DehI